MQTSEFSVCLAARPWAIPRVYVDYSQADSGRIEAGIRAMLTEPGAKKTLLIPLGPLPNGMRFYVAVIRDWSDERWLKVSQYRLEMLPDGMVIRTKAVETPDTFRAAFPHVRFTTERVDTVDSKHLFWKAHRKQSELEYVMISLSNPQHGVAGGMGLGYDIRTDGWTRPATLLHHHVYGRAISTRMEIALHEMCQGVRTALVVYLTGSRFIAILRNGTSINLVDVNVVSYPAVKAFEHMVIFQPQMAQIFPGFQFTSTRFTDAEKQVVFQAPALKHYQALNDKHYRNSRTTAMGMSLHPRLGSSAANHIGCLGSDVLIKIANMAF
jgi:hypothetical protein